MLLVWAFGNKKVQSDSVRPGGLKTLTFGPSASTYQLALK